MNDAEHEDDTVIHEHVVHHSMIADAEPMEAVFSASNRLDCLAANPAQARDLERKPLECIPHAVARAGVELAERLCRGRRELDPKFVQVRSDRLMVRSSA